MRRSLMRRAAKGAVCAMAAALLAAACSADPTPTPAVTAEEARDRAAAALRALSSARFRVTHENDASTNIGFASLTEAEGDALFPDRARFTLQAATALFPNASLQIDVVQIGETTYLRDGISRQWQTLPAGTLGIDFSNVAGSIADALASMRSAELADSRGSVRRLTGLVDAASLRGLVPAAPEGETLRVEAWTEREDFLPRGIRVEGALFPDDPPDIARTLEISRFDVPVVIEPPG